MLFPTFITLGLAATHAVMAAPITNTTASAGHTSGGAEHIVLLSSNAPHVNEVLSRLSLHPDHSDVKYVFNNSAFRGFAANMNTHCITALSAMDDVSHEPAVQITSLRQNMPRDDAQTLHTTGSPWGLQRISSLDTPTGDESSMSFTYSYNTSTSSSSPGEGVDIYVVDTGINTAHLAFNGRARIGFSYSATDVEDLDGHGTHVAGTAGASTFGVASGANLIAVKVLGADGTGSSSDTIAGMDYVVSTHDARKSDPSFRGSIMSMSWGLSSTSSAIDAAIAAAASAGVHVAVAAGNDGADACNYSPASSGGAASPYGVVSVGSIDMSGAISSFSNTGSCVDLYAPGEDILSTWKEPGDNVVNFLSGTSMATPHVTGVMAYLLGLDYDQGGSLAQDVQGLKARLMSLTLNTNVAGELLLNNGNTDSSAMVGLAPSRKLARRSTREGAWEVKGEKASLARVRW